MEKLWFSIYNFNLSYPGHEPPYEDPGKFEWAEELKNNSENIFSELKAYLNTHELDAYFNTSMVNKKNSWKTVALKTWSIELFKNQKHFPFTTSLLNKYAQIVSASFNLLEPKSKILPHCGDTNAIYRCHLGLDVPTGLPETGLKVKGESRAWKNNQWLVFMDAYMHEAWNDADKNRYIFLIDVIRDEFKDKKKIICSTVLTSLFLQKRAIKFKSLISKPSLVKLFSRTLRPFAQLSIFVVNRFKIY